MKSTVAYLVLFAILGNPVFAATPTVGAGLADDSSRELRGSEYVLRRFPGEKLMPIRILGGVQKPGVYYLPEGTDLLTALSLSGGLAPNADGEKIRLNQWATKEYKTVELEKAMSRPVDFNPSLGANDVLVVEEKRQIVSSNTLLLLTVLSSLVGITVGAVFIARGR